MNATQSYQQYPPAPHLLDQNAQLMNYNQNAPAHFPPQASSQQKGDGDWLDALLNEGSSSAHSSSQSQPQHQQHAVHSAPFAVDPSSSTPYSVQPQQAPYAVNPPQQQNQLYQPPQQSDPYLQQMNQNYAQRAPNAEPSQPMIDPQAATQAYSSHHQMPAHPQQSNFPQQNSYSHASPPPPPHYYASSGPPPEQSHCNPPPAAAPSQQPVYAPPPPHQTAAAPPPHPGYAPSPHQPHQAPAAPHPPQGYAPSPYQTPTGSGHPGYAPGTQQIPPSGPPQPPTYPPPAGFAPTYPPPNQPNVYHDSSSNPPFQAPPPQQHSTGFIPQSAPPQPPHLATHYPPTYPPASLPPPAMYPGSDPYGYASNAPMLAGPQQYPQTLPPYAPGGSATPAYSPTPSGADPPPPATSAAQAELESTTAKIEALRRKIEEHKKKEADIIKARQEHEDEVLTRRTGSTHSSGPTFASLASVSASDIPTALELDRKRLQEEEDARLALMLQVQEQEAASRQRTSSREPSVASYTGFQSHSAPSGFGHTSNREIQETNDAMLARRLQEEEDMRARQQQQARNRPPQPPPSSAPPSYTSSSYAPMQYPAHSQESGWSCPQCTLLNSVHAGRCSACHAPNPMGPPRPPPPPAAVHSQPSPASGPPEWVPDTLAARCMREGCGTVFGISQRRHHCRVCGLVFCNACTSRRVTLPDGTKGQRACDKCYFMSPEGKQGY